MFRERKLQNIQKKITTILVLLLLPMIPALVLPVHATTQDALHVAQAKVQNSSGKNITLVGLNYGDYPNNVLPNQFNTGSATQDAQNIKNAGFNSVALTIEWGWFELGPSNAYNYNSTYETLVNSRITALTGQGLYVILRVLADCDSPATAHPQMCTNIQSVLGSNYCGSSVNKFKTAMQLPFYTTPRTTQYSGMDHLTQLWQRLSSDTASNSLVVGYDPLNEPTFCTSGQDVTIQQNWHPRINEMVSVLRNAGDNRIIFLEEAPFFDHFGGSALGSGLTYRNTDITFSNYVAVEHYYQSEVSAWPSWTPCNTTYSFLNDYYGNYAKDQTCSSGKTALYVAQAQAAFPSQAFYIGEFGAINGNAPGDAGQQWNQAATSVFYNNGVSGWAYWSAADTGTWIQDIQPKVTMTFSLNPFYQHYYTVCSPACYITPLTRMNITQLTMLSINGFNGTTTAKITPYNSSPGYGPVTNFEGSGTGSEQFTVSPLTAGVDKIDVLSCHATPSGTWTFTVTASGGGIQDTAATFTDYVTGTGRTSCPT